MSLSRAKFLTYAAATPLLASIARAVEAAPSRGAPYVDRDFLIRRNQLQQWIHWMSAQGPRYTGNAAHQTFIDFLRYEYAVAGLRVQDYPYAFSRWDAAATGLTITPAGGAPMPVTVSSYYVRSGSTPAQGVTAPLVYGGQSTAIDTTNVSGKIVYVEFEMPPLPLQALFTPFSSYPTGAMPPAEEINAGFSFIFLPTLTALQNAGAVGAIIGWTNISDAMAKDQYQPFLTAGTQLPTLFVPKSQTASMRTMSLPGTTTATLTLTATTYANSPTSTVIATLPGLTTENIIINTHTDGPNVVEENGAVVMLSMARYFARIPIQKRMRNLIFVMASGHMNEPLVPTGQWIAQRPDIVKNAVACVTVEHLGSLQYLDNVQGVYTDNGNDFAVVQTQNTGMASAMSAALQGTAAMPTEVADPAIFFGLGSALNNLNIPTNGFIMGPAYLLTGSPNGEIDKVSFPLMFAQTQALTSCVRLLDGMTAAQIAGNRVAAPATPAGLVLRSHR